MKIIFFGLATAGFSLGGMASATVMPTALENGVTLTGTTLEDDSTRLNDATWFTFSGQAGDMIDIDINRLTAPNDLFATLFFGDVAGLDFGDALLDAVTFGGGSNIPGLSFIDFEDDTEENTLGGPFGDPRFTLTLTQSGTFSVVVGHLFPDPDGSFEITLNGATPVPAPGAALLMLTGLLGIGLRRSRMA